MARNHYKVYMYVMGNSLDDYMFLLSEFTMSFVSYNALCRSLEYLNKYFSQVLVFGAIRFTSVYLGESYPSDPDGRPLGTSDNQLKLPF